MRKNRKLTELAISCCYAVLVQALAPPHHDFIGWESVHKERRRLGIEYRYQPIHVPAEHCRYLTEEECERFDNFVAQRKRELQQQRVFPPATNPAIGDRVRVLVLLMRFKDYDEAMFGPLPPRSYYDMLFNGNGPTDANPIGSVKDFLRYNSLGKYRVSFDVRDWEVTEKTEAEYAGGTSGRDQPLQEIFMRALTKLDQSNSISWVDGYINEFGRLNHLIVLTSGFAAEAGDRRCLPGSHKDRLWSNGSPKPFDNEVFWQSKDFYAVGGWCLTSALGIPACNRQTGELNPIRPAGIAITSHEYIHGFGMPDLYDMSGELELGGIGKFGLMSSLQGWDFSFDTPGHMSCWIREQLGWNEPIVIERDGYYAVQPLQIANSCYKIVHGYPEGEYLLIENKQPLKWDRGVEQGGIVIYHVDNKANQQRERGYPGFPGWPAKHYMVAVVQADGLFSIEKGDDNGDVGDFWIRGAKLGPGPTQPNTDAYQGGNLRRTGVAIEAMTSSAFIMMFRVTGIGNRGAGIAPLIPGNNSAPQADGQQHPLLRKDSTGQAIQWLLAMFGGLSLLVGLIVFFL